jgi:hypothetical protein
MVDQVRMLGPTVIMGLLRAVVQLFFGEQTEESVAKA